MLGVPTPAMRSIIHLASIMHGVDYMSLGRTVDKLGIAGMSVKDIRFFIVGAENKKMELKPGKPKEIDYTLQLGFGRHGHNGGT
jgi:hypothetical protein